MSLAIIVAVAENGIIGRKNGLPWHLPGDLKHFAQLTTNHTVVMGLNTYKSILSLLGHPLPKRRNVILTFTADPSIPEQQVTSWEEIIKLGANEEVFIIGGASVYAQALPLVEKIYLTRVQAKPEGDVSFPPLAETEWRLSSDRLAQRQANDEYDYSFQIYERKK